MDANRRHLEEWLQVIDLSSYYELLGVLEIADDDAIRDAFHRFCESFHPDRHRDEDEATRSKISRVFKRGVEAYRVLREPELRGRYDLGLAQGKLRLDVDQRAGGSKASSLRDLCATPAGRLHAGRAEDHLNRGEVRAALASLRRAVDAEGDSPFLEERLDALRQLAELHPE